MKTLGIENTTLDACVQDAQSEQVVITSHGTPVAIVYGLKGLDTEQLSLSQDAEFWKLIAARRQQPTIDRDELERRLNTRQ